MDSSSFIEKLSRIGIASLAEELGEVRSENLHNLGIPFDASTLAQALFQEKGYSVLKTKQIRINMLKSFSRHEISDHFVGSGTLNELVDSAANFRWGNNNQTFKFLSFFDINPNDVFANTTGLDEFETDVLLDKPLFDFQNEMRKELISLFRNDSHNRLIAHMPTGSGKTRTTMEAVCDFIRGKVDNKNAYVVWMAHSDELCEQAVQTFEELWKKIGPQNAKVYRFWGGRPFGDISGDDPTFIVTSFQTCHAAMSTAQNEKFEKLLQIRKNCGLLIVDEAHMSVAPTYSEAINFFSNRNTKLIGLTATPGRDHVGGDGTGTQKLSNFYNNNKITLSEQLLVGENPIEFLQNRKILSRVNRYKIETKSNITLSPNLVAKAADLLDLPAEVLKELGEDAARTNMIGADIIKLAEIDKKQTIVFCPTKQNACDLALLLQMKDCKARAITGETPMSERRNYIEAFRMGEINVLTNFGVLTAGFDAPNIEAVVIARPTTSVVLYSQMIGRGLRGSAVGGSDFCVLVDVIDNIQNMPELPHAFTYFDEFFEGVK